MRQFVKGVEEKALGVQVIKGVKPEQMLVRVVNDELVELMGGKKEDLVDPDNGPQVSRATFLLCLTSCCSDSCNGAVHSYHEPSGKYGMSKFSRECLHNSFLFRVQAF